MTPTRLAGLMSALAFALAAGCGPTATPTPPTKKDEPPAHSHPTVGPAGGVIIEWGDEDYHLEFLADRKAGEATVYILDDTATKVTTVTAKTLTLSLAATPPVTLTLTAKPQDGDAPGSSSRFFTQNDALKGEGLLSGSVSGEVDGKKFTGDFKQKAAKK